MFKKFAAVIAVCLFMFPAIGAASAKKKQRVCTKPPPVFDLVLTLDPASCGTSGNVRQCAYPAPQAKMRGAGFVFNGCAAVLVRKGCRGVWEPSYFVCVLPERVGSQESL